MAGKLLITGAAGQLGQALARAGVRQGWEVVATDVLGLPAVTLPTGRPACGIMAMGAAGADRHLLRVARAIEAALSPSS